MVELRGRPATARVAVHLGLLLLAGLTHKDASTLLYVLPIAAIVLAAAARNGNREFDAIDMFWFLISIFFIVRPAQTLIDNTVSLYAASAPIHYDADIVSTAFVAVYIAVLVAILVLPASGRPARIVEFVSNRWLYLLTAISGFAIVLAFNGGLSNVLAARYDKEGGSLLALAAIGEGMLIAATAMQLAVASAERGTRQGEWVAAVICLALTAIVLNPLNTSRFGLLSAWLPLALIALPVLRRPLVFAATSLLGILVVMPLLSLSTRFGLDVERAATSFDEPSSLYALPYIDTFDTLLHGIYYAQTFGYQSGAKVVSILLLLVPRAWWPEKPLVSGLDIGNHLFAMRVTGTPNLSMPLVGDFYMDFGLAGVAVGSLIAALLFRGLLRLQPGHGGVPVFGYLVVGMLPILVRGAVAAVVLLPACTLIACATLTVLSRWLSRAKLSPIPAESGGAG